MEEVQPIPLTQQKLQELVSFVTQNGEKSKNEDHSVEKGEETIEDSPQIENSDEDEGNPKDERIPSDKLAVQKILKSANFLVKNTLSGIEELRFQVDFYLKDQDYFQESHTSTCELIHHSHVELFKIRKYIDSIVDEDLKEKAHNVSHSTTKCKYKLEDMRRHLFWKHKPISSAEVKRVSVQ